MHYNIYLYRERLFNFFFFQYLELNFYNYLYCRQKFSDRMKKMFDKHIIIIILCTQKKTYFFIYIIIFTKIENSQLLTVSQCILNFLFLIFSLHQIYGFGVLKIVDINRTYSILLQKLKPFSIHFIII